VFNYFTTLTQELSKCDPQNQECCGADDANELARQRAKIIADKPLTRISSAIEIENHPGDVPTADLVSGPNDGRRNL
jgi:predicted extracellular nuclease